MKIKSILLSFIRVLIAGVLACAILTLFCFLYYNIPVHYSNESGATDYVWEQKVFYSRGTEGFACGHTNNEGLLNTFDYTEETDIDILLMGSSHMEAYNVSLGDSTAGVLNQLYGRDCVYNIGVSGHDFFTCASNFNSALDYYKPNQFVIIETHSIEFEDSKLEQVLNNEYPEIPSHNSGIVARLQQNQFLRLSYAQVGATIGNATKVEGVESVKSSTNNELLLKELLSSFKNKAEELQIKVVLLYHPSINLKSDGTIAFNTDLESLECIENICEDNGIIFVNMQESFVEAYNCDYILPYGFTNSSIASGHLNKHGHRLIAEELYNVLEEVD